MNKNAIIAVAVVALLAGAAVVWHFTGHAGLDHHGAAHASVDGHDSHHDHAGGSQKLELNDGQRWATDSHLRAGMSKIHDRAKPALAAYQEGRFGAQESKEVAGLVRGEVKTLIENCSLEPQADAMLHIVIGDLMSAASAMEADPASEEGVPKLVAALHDYSKHFDHPDF